MSDEKELLIFLLEKALEEVRSLTKCSRSRDECCCCKKEHNLYEDMYRAWIEKQGCQAKI
jgi:hypothetical protein